MKNLKKILVALALVAVLVSSIVTVAIADASYTGTVDGAKEIFAAVDEAVGSDKMTLAEAKGAELTKVYTYLKENPVDPKEDGYADFIKLYNETTFKVAYSYVADYVGDKLEESLTNDKCAESLAALHVYLKSAPIIGDEASVSIYLGYECDKCGAYKAFNQEQFFAGSADGLTCPKGCGGAAKLGGAYSFAEFHEDYNTLSAHQVNNVVLQLFKLSENAELSGYYDVALINKALADFTENVLEISYVEPESELYTGDPAEAMAIISGVSTDSSVADIRAALVSLYNYMRENPINPTTDEFSAILDEYDALCVALVNGVRAEMASKVSPEDKIAVLLDFRAYLVGDGENEGTILSEKVCAAFNELRLELADEFNRADDQIAELPEANVSVIVPSYENDFEEIDALLTALEKLPAGDANIPFLIDELYVKYAGVSFDINAEDYASIAERYNAVTASYVENKYVEKMNSLSRIGERYTVLAEMYTFLKSTPLSGAAIEVYNNARITLLEDAKMLSQKISGDNLPVYTKPQKAEPTVSIEVLSSLLNEIKDSYYRYDKYLAAGSDEDRAEALVEMQAALADMRAYIVGSVIDTEAEYYAEFIAEYSALRATIVDAFFAEVTSLENGEAKLAALASLGEYLAENPTTFADVVAYNALVDELVDDAEAAAQLKVDSIFYEIAAALEKVNDASISIDERIDTILEINSFKKRPLDITDPAYDAAFAQLEAAVAAMAGEMEEDIINAFNNLSVEDAVALVSARLAFVKEINTEALVFSFRKAVKANADTCQNIIKKIDANDPTVATYVTLHKKADAELLSFENAESFEERAAAFAPIYNKFVGEYTVFVFTSSSEYAELKERFDAIVAAFEAELISLTALDKAPFDIYEDLKTVYDNIVALPFSEAVINAYTEALVAANEADFSQYSAQIDTAVEPVSYTVPEGWSTELARVIIALERATDGEAQVKDKAEFYVAYKILAGLAGVEGPVLIDFANDKFVSVINKFNEAKALIAEDYTKLVFDAVNVEDKIAALKDLAEFLNEYHFSKDLVDFYNNIRAEVAVNYDAESNAAFLEFSELNKKLHDVIAKFPVNESLLSTMDKERAVAIRYLVEASEFFEVFGKADYFYTINGENALIYQNIVADELTWYINSYGLDSHSDRELANAQLRYSFVELLLALDKEIASMSEDKAQHRIETVGSYLANNGIPQNLLNIFNAKYNTNYDAGATSALSGKVGTVEEFAAVYQEFCAATSVDSMRIAITKLAKYVNSNPLDGTNQIDKIEATVSAIQEELAALTAAQREKLDFQAPLSEYDLIRQHYYTHEDGKIYTSSLSQNSDKTATHAIKSDGANRYAELAVTTSASPYFNLKLTGTEMGFVVELDLMSPENLNFQLNFTEDGLTYGERVTTRALLIKNGQLQYIFGDYSGTRDDKGFPGYQEGVDAPITFTPGQWTHFTLVMDVEKLEMEVLIDYVSLGRKPIITAASSSKKEDTCKFTELRFQSPSTYSTICYDNLQAYAGTAVRTYDKFETMSSEDKFNYYVDYAMDESCDPVDRLFAFYAAENLKAFVGEASDAHKERFETFDVSDIESVARETHIQRIESLVSGIDVDAMNSKTVAEISVALDAANAYIEANRLYIDQGSDRFIAANDILVAAAEKREWLNVLAEYIKDIGRFHRATSLASLERHYEALNEKYDILRLDKDKEAALAEADPAAQDFLKQMKADESVTALVPNITFVGYYTEYIPARMHQQLCVENSQKILDCISFIEILVPGGAEMEETAYFEALLEAALENADYVDPYMVVIRAIVNADAYIFDTEGMERALRIFEILDAMFFENLQTQHFATIKEQLDRYVKTDSYIEKAGICTFVRNYIESNGVDMSSPEGIQYMYALENYEKELDAYMVDYEAILASNTAAFIGTVQKMSAYRTYAELKPLYDEAIANYYYSMNVDSEEVKAAIAEFAEYEAMINDWEYNAAMFLGYVETLESARRTSHKYRALVNCAAYVDSLDEGVEGVSKALKTYNEKLAEYNEYIDGINGEIVETMDVSSAIRTNSITAVILAVVQNLISK